jgi:hypothetical protein
MNQREWYDYIQEVTRRHIIEMAELRNRHEMEIKMLQQHMLKAEPAPDFKFGLMRSIDTTNLRAEADRYDLSA